MTTCDLVLLFNLVQGCQLLEDKNAVVQEVEHDRDEHSKGHAPGGSSSPVAVGGIASACKARTVGKPGVL